MTRVFLGLVIFVLVGVALARPEPLRTAQTIAVAKIRACQPWRQNCHERFIA